MNDHFQLTQLYRLFENQAILYKPDIATKLNLNAEELDKLLYRLRNLGFLFSESQKTLEFERKLPLLKASDIDAMLFDFVRQQLRILPPFLSTHSTNQVIKEYAVDLESHGYVAIAEHQFAGRGRQGKEWMAPLGKSVLMSLGIRLDLAVTKIGFISLLVGISLVEVLSDLGFGGVTIKWPNDVYWNDAKLAGILIESVKLFEGDVRLIIGIGLNVNFEEDEGGEISQSWVDLSQVSNERVCRNTLIALILNQLILNVRKFEISGSVGFMPQWRKFDYLYGKSIVLTGESRPQVTGIAKGVNDQGELLIQSNDGCLQTVFSGEVSVRSFVK